MYRKTIKAHFNPSMYDCLKPNRIGDNLESFKRLSKLENDQKFQKYLSFIEEVPEVNDKAYNIPSTIKQSDFLSSFFINDGKPIKNSDGGPVIKSNNLHDSQDISEENSNKDPANGLSKFDDYNVSDDIGIETYNLDKLKDTSKRKILSECN